MYQNETNQIFRFLIGLAVFAPIKEQLQRQSHNSQPIHPQSTFLLNRATQEIGCAFSAVLVLNEGFVSFEI